jgi:MoaA/NifB/PqqE/SkfB family radical SAM enzyme/protein-L-isoaspartate O-methyltransferase
MRGDEFFQTIATRPPFTKLHPRLAGFFKEYFTKEKVVSFRSKSVLNTHFPPYPSPSFDQLVSHFAEVGNAANRRLYSVTLALTNRCPFHCWHCYNAGRSQQDIPLPELRKLACQLQDLGAVMVTLTGGEPLMRGDLSEIIRSFDRRSCLILGTTGEGLTPERARMLQESGLFAIGISLDSDQSTEHDRLRGRSGAFETAIQALRIARENGLYPYVVSVASRDFLQPSRFLPFLRFAADAGALEVHLLEPCAIGRLAGHNEVLLSAEERRRIFEYQEKVARDETLPILSSFAYLESPDAFGCGAGLTHLYVDGSGEVCPCNLVPLSFGNIIREPFDQILDRMGRYFRQPRTGCVGKLLVNHFPRVQFPAAPAESESICEDYLPADHALPRFFQLRQEVEGENVGAAELREAYNRVHGDYDEFWLAAAGQPIETLVGKLPWTGRETVFEAGCGTGFATALLARHAGRVLAVDLSEAMQSEARRRLARMGLSNKVELRTGDALAALRLESNLDVIFSSWVLGYIPLAPFFDAARTALKRNGRLGFIVHREHSPREPLEIFAQLVAEDPTVLQKRVAFDFPRDVDQVRALVEAAGFEIESALQEAIEFRYPTAGEVLDHLLKSGAGTAFYDAVDPACRPALTRRFLELIGKRHGTEPEFVVRHDYAACIARRVQ